ASPIGVGRKDGEGGRGRGHTGGAEDSVPRGGPMPSPAELYPLIVAWLQALDLARHPLAVSSLAQLVSALLVGQSLRPSALMRALVSPGRSRRGSATSAC